MELNGNHNSVEKSYNNRNGMQFMKFVVYVMAMSTAAIGTIISSFVADIINLPELISAIIWFLISLVTYMGAKRMKESEWFKMLSLDFILTWAFTCIGVILGFIILVLIDKGSLTINLDQIVNLFYATLPLALGPTATTSLGLRD